MHLCVIDREILRRKKIILHFHW